MTMTWPNKSPEPTAVGAYLFTRRFPSCHVAVPPWLSFFVRPLDVALRCFGVELAGADLELRKFDRQIRKSSSSFSMVFRLRSFDELTGKFGSWLSQRRCLAE